MIIRMRYMRPTSRPIRAEFSIVPPRMGTVPCSEPLRHAELGIASPESKSWFLGLGTVHQPREFGFSEFAEQLEELPGPVP